MSAHGNQVDVPLACPVPPGQAPAPSHFPAEGRSDACNVVGPKGARAAWPLLQVPQAGLPAPARVAARCLAACGSAWHFGLSCQ